MPKDDKKTQILDATFELLLTLGPRKVTLDDVAERVGLTKTALYHYFPSKEAIFRATIQRIARQIIEAVELAVDRARGPEAKLSAMFATRFRILEELQESHQLTLDQVLEMDPLTQEAKFVMFEAEFGLAEQILREGLARGVFSMEDPRIAAEILVLALRGVDEHRFVSRRAMSAYQVQFQKMVLDGLRPR